MRTRLYRIAFLGLLAMLTLNLIAVSAFSSPGPTTIYLDPSNYIFDTSTATVGTLFNVTVMVRDVVDLITYQVCIHFNDTILSVTRWYEPTLDTAYVFYGKTTLAVPAPPTVAYDHIGPNLGAVTVGSALFPAPSPGGGSSGSGKLCIIQFKITAAPPSGQKYSCWLDTNNVDTYLLNSYGDEISGVVKEKGYYELSSPAGAYDVTVKAYCQTEETEVNVAIEKDGVPTGFNTPFSFMGLIGAHTFTVPASDPSGHAFDKWSTGETSTTITVSSSGTFTANYGKTAPYVPATVDFHPDALNLLSKGNWVTAYIELPEDYDVNDINVSSIKLNNAVSAELNPTCVGDYDSDGIPDLMVKFDRAAVIACILSEVGTPEKFGTVTLTLKGKLYDGTPFSGSKSNKTILNKPSKYQMLPL